MGDGRLYWMRLEPVVAALGVAPLSPLPQFLDGCGTVAATIGLEL